MKKAKVFKLKKGGVQIFEVAWFTNYKKTNQELHTKNFITLKEAEDFYYKSMASKEEMVFIPREKNK
jgi:hypothetical protein